MGCVEIEYLRPAVAGDTLEITTWLHQMRGSRAIRRYEIRTPYQDELLVTARGAVGMGRSQNNAPATDS
ncbi:acyl-CoA thioesterase [Tolypothrix sp. VBCCA 56010]|uniref:acyl-CoA thioesterase n=1 Tax=Tolypothrix sp. VBCCA 56010 TaxID=3137731 RepID=UPI003D7D254A